MDPMKKISGKIHTYFLDLPQGYNLSLDNNLIITIEEFQKENSLSVFKIEGTIKSSITDYDKYLREQFAKFLNIINFLYNTSFTEFSIDYEISDKKKTKVVKEVSIYINGKLKPKSSELLSIQKKQLTKFSKEQLLCLKLYAQATNSEDLYAKYWYLYTIASILLGDRPKIKKYFNNYLNPRKTYSDYKDERQKIPNFIFMRDLFSHINATSHGKIVNKDEFLEKYIHDFIEEIKQLLKNKFMS